MRKVKYLGRMYGKCVTRALFVGRAHHVVLLIGVLSQLQPNKTSMSGMKLCCP